jgi:hypothetical protein
MSIREEQMLIFCPKRLFRKHSIFREKSVDQYFHSHPISIDYSILENGDLLPRSLRFLYDFNHIPHQMTEIERSLCDGEGGAEPPVKGK